MDRVCLLTLNALKSVCGGGGRKGVDLSYDRLRCHMFIYSLSRVFGAPLELVIVRKQLPVILEVSSAGWVAVCVCVCGKGGHFEQPCV